MEVKNTETGYGLDFNEQPGKGIVVTMFTHNESWDVELTEAQANEIRVWLSIR